MTDEMSTAALAQEGAYDAVPDDPAWKVQDGDSFVPLDEYTGNLGLDAQETRTARKPGMRSGMRTRVLPPPRSVKREPDLAAKPVPPQAPEPEEKAMLEHDEKVLHAFAKILPSLEPDDALQTIAHEATSKFSKYIRNCFGPRAWLRPHGTWVQGSHMQNSEVQIRLDFRTRKTPKDGSLEVKDDCDPEKELQMKKTTMEKLATKIINNEKSPYKVFDAETRRPITDVETVKATSPIEYTIEYSSEQASVRIALGIGTDASNGVQIDFVDRVIRRMLAHTPEALHLIHLVRRWTQVAELESVSNGFLGPLGWTLLCLFYFVNRGDADPSSLYEAEESEQNDVSALPPLLLRDEQGDASIEVLVEFFEMVSGFSTWLDDDNTQGTWGISLVSGALVLGKNACGAPFFIEDPGVKIASGIDFNVATGLTTDGWRCILSSCQAAADVLKDQSSASSALSWLEALILDSTRQADGQDRASEEGVPRPAGKRSRLAEIIEAKARAARSGAETEGGAITGDQQAKRPRLLPPPSTAKAQGKGAGKSGKWSQDASHAKPACCKGKGIVKGIVNKGAGKSGKKW